jgi:hypothetical protein
VEQGIAKIYTALKNGIFSAWCVAVSYGFAKSCIVQDIHSNQAF